MPSAVFCLLLLVSAVALEAAATDREKRDTPDVIRIFRDLARVLVATIDDFILTPVSNLLTGGRGFPWQKPGARGGFAK